MGAEALEDVYDIVSRYEATTSRLCEAGLFAVVYGLLEKQVDIRVAGVLKWFFLGFGLLYMVALIERALRLHKVLRR